MLQVADGRERVGADKCLLFCSFRVHGLLQNWPQSGNREIQIPKPDFGLPTRARGGGEGKCCCPAGAHLGGKPGVLRAVPKGENICTPDRSLRSVHRSRPRGAAPRTRVIDMGFLGSELWVRAAGTGGRQQL